MSSDVATVVILGSGGHARVLFEALRETGVRVVGYVGPTGEGSRLAGVTWLGDDGVLEGLPEGVDIVNGIGSVGAVQRRADAYARAIGAGRQFRTVIHPRAIVDATAVVGAGAQILAGSLVGVGARIGEDAIVNTGAIVEHDCVVGPHSHVASGVILAGDVTVGEGTHIGMGARVIQGVNIGASCVVGAGAVVLGDLPDGTKAVGIPARVLHAERGVL